MNAQVPIAGVLACAAALLQTGAAVTLTLRIADGREAFRPGEIIPIELEFNSSIPKRFAVDGATYDRSGRLTIDEFVVEPNDAVTDPLLDYFATAGGMLGGGRGIGVLGEKPFVVTLDLNDWFRFDVPGRYRLSVRSRRVTDETQRTESEQSIVPVESNEVAFEILPRDSQWEAAQVASALPLLDSNQDMVRAKGCRILRFLANEAAVTELIARFDRDCRFDAVAGLYSAPNRAFVVRQMEAGLLAPGQPVSPHYIRTLAILSVYLQQPELRPKQTREAKGRHVAARALTHLPDLVDAAEESYTERLMPALPQKSARARALTLASLLDSRTSSRREIGRQLAAVFLSLPAQRQADLLNFRWRSLAGPEMVPALRQLVVGQGRPPGSGANIALRRLYELAPEEGRGHILNEVANPRSEMSLETLGMLPDRELPELDDVLASAVDPDADYHELSIRAELLHRYASRGVAARVFAQLGDLIPRLACRPQAALLAYFMRAEPELGRTLLQRVLSSRKETGCYRGVLHDVATLRMTSDVESAALELLDDPDPEVASDAITTLGDFGSAASREAVRKAFERWHLAWRGRQEELRFSHLRDRTKMTHASVESAFLRALGAGLAWHATPPDVAELRPLCVTDICRSQTDHLISAAAEREIEIVRDGGSGDFLASIGPYHLHSRALLERKLLQYPKGSAFVLDTQLLDADAASALTSGLVAFAERHGIRLTRPAK